jgi:hypothetical protein
VEIAAAIILLGTQSTYAAGEVYASFVDAGEIVSGKNIVALTIPPGKYAILAKINIDQDDGKISKKLLTVSCILRSVGVSDTNVIRLHPSAIQGSIHSDNGAMPFQVVTELRANTQISMGCTFPFSESRKLSFRFAKITAIRVEGSLCEKPSPAICSDTASDVFATFRESGSITAGVPIVKLSVPRGRYAIFAKINLDQDDTQNHARVLCALRAGTDSDRNVIALQQSGENRLDNAAVPFQAVEEFQTPLVNPSQPVVSHHDIDLTCRITDGESSKLSFRFAKIMAIRVDGSVCEKPSPAECGKVSGDLYATFKESGSIVSDEPILRLGVPAGLYAVFAKINTDQDDTTNWVTVVCTLQADLDLDRNVSRLQPSGLFAVDNDTVPLHLLQILPEGSLGGITTSCKFDAAESSLLSFRYAKITALRIHGNRCEKPSPANCLPR